jgi:hypothetical protein
MGPTQNARQPGEECVLCPVVVERPWQRPRSCKMQHVQVYFAQVVWSHACAAQVAGSTLCTSMHFAHVYNFTQPDLA